MDKLYWQLKVGLMLWICPPNGALTTPTKQETIFSANHSASANHKAAYEASVAETAKYAGGVTPSLELFHTGKVLVPGVEIKMKFHFNSPTLFLNGVGLNGRLVEGDVRL